MPITRIPPQESSGSGVQLDISAPGRVAQGQAEIGNQVDRFNRTIIDAATTLLKQDKPKVDKSLLVNAELNAKLAAAQAVQNRLNYQLDENGNPTFSTLPTDLRDLTSEAYNAAGEGLPSELQGEWQKKSKSASVAAQIRGIGLQSSAQQDWIQTQSIRSFELAKQEAAGDLSKDIDIIIKEHNQNIDQLIGTGGDLSSAEASKISNARTLKEQRFNALLEADPGQAEQFISRMDEFNANEKNNLQDRVDARYQAAQQQLTAKDKKVIDYIEDEIKKGRRVSPDILNQLITISNTNPELAQEAKVASIMNNVVEDFKNSSPEVQDRIIQVLEAGEQTPGSSKFLDTLKSVVQSTRESRNQDPTQYAIQTGKMNDLGVFDPTGDLSVQIKARHEQSQLASSIHGEQVSGFTSNDIKQISKFIKSATDDQQVLGLLQNIMAEYGPDSRLVFAEILDSPLNNKGENAATHFAIAGMLALNGQTDAAETLINGRRLRDNKHIEIPSKAAFLEVIQEENLIAKGLPAPIRSAKIAAIMDAYASLSNDAGVLSTTVDDDIEDMVIEAAKIVNTGELIEVDSPTGDDHFIEPPNANITNEEQFEEFMGSLSDKEIEALGGIQGVAGQYQDFIKKQLEEGNLFFISIGPGRYTMRYRVPRGGDSEHPTQQTKHGGPITPSMTAEVRDQEGNLLIIDLGVVNDVKAGAHRPREIKAPSLNVDDEASKLFGRIRVHQDDFEKALAPELSEAEQSALSPKGNELSSPAPEAMPDIITSAGKETRLSMRNAKSITTQELFTYNKQTNFSEALGHNTKNNAHIKYKFGNKSTKSGGIDCSGWIAENTLNVLKGTPQYNKVKSLINTAAAYQISQIGAITGITPDSAIKQGKVEPGMIIGIRKPQPPAFAQQRPRQISHIVQVVTVDGQLMISESTTARGNNGVSLTPLGAWLRAMRRNTLYGVNPFKVR